jgi:hypothetical protein
MNQAAELKERVLASVRRVPSPVRTQGRREARQVLAASLGLALALFFAAGGVRRGLGRPAWWVAASVLAWGAVAVVSLWTAWRAGIARGAGAVTSLATVIVGAPSVLLVVSLVLARIDPDLVHALPGRPWLHCFALTLAAAACPLVGLSRARRSSEPTHPIASGSALGVASGACAGVMVDLWCLDATPRHVLVGHVLPMGLLALLGAMLGARVIAMRSRQRLSA